MVHSRAKLDLMSYWVFEMLLVLTVAPVERDLVLRVDHSTSASNGDLLHRLKRYNGFVVPWMPYCHSVLFVFFIPVIAVAYF